MATYKISLGIIEEIPQNTHLAEERKNKSTLSNKQGRTGTKNEWAVRAMSTDRSRELFIVNSGQSNTSDRLLIVI